MEVVKQTFMNIVKYLSGMQCILLFEKKISSNNTVI